MFDVLASATVTLSDLMVRHGRVLGMGGGVRNFGTLTLERVIVRKNVTEADALQEIFAVAAGIANGGTLTVVESAAGDSGGIGNTGTLDLLDSTVSGNSTSLGPAISTAGPLSVVGSAGAHNSSGPGGASGIRALPLSAPPFTPFTLANTIVTDNLTFMTPANVQCEHTSSLGGNLARTAPARSAVPATPPA